MSPRRSFTTALAVALALGAMGPQAVFGSPTAKTVMRPGPGERDGSRPGTTIVRVSDRSGFDWADAGIGAAGGFALAVLGVGLALLVFEHRAERWSYLRAAGTHARVPRHEPSRSESK